MKTLKKCIVLAVVTAFVSPLLSGAYAADDEQQRYLEQLREMQQILRAEDGNPSRLGELREEYESLREEITAWQQKKREEREALQKKRLMMVRFYKERLKTNDSSNSGLVSDTSSSVVSRESGQASYYADKFNGRSTASGEIFSNSLFTAAHRTLPFGTRVRVTNTSNGQTVEVTVNDRGPYVAGRVIDLSAAAFEALDNLSRGVINVEVEVLAE